MNDATQVRLTLLFPPALEDRVIALILEQEPPLPGFTVVAADGHGADFSHASIREQVRGRIARKLLTVFLPAPRAEALIGTLREQLATSKVAWWLEPVIAFGRLG